MNKFMRLFALLLVVVAIVLVVLSFKFSGNDHAAHVAATPTTAQPAQHKATPHQETYAVVSAATVLKPGVPIAADDVKIVQRTHAMQGGFDSIDQAVGKILAVRVDAGSALTRYMLLDDLSLKLQPGERAVSIPVDETSGVGYHIHPGDYVDVFFNLKHKKSSGNAQITQSRLLLSRVRVLAYGTRKLPKATAEPVSKDKDKKTRPSSNQRFSARAAVVAIPVDKVNRLLLAEHRGKLTLALRSPTDPALPDTSLFPQPAPVLIAEAKPKTDPPATDPANTDPADTNAKLDQSINHAYAGIDLDGLASADQKHQRARRSSHATHHYHRVEIIRGTERGHITEHNGGATR